MYIWGCRIGAELDWETLPREAEETMRQAVMKAFRELTGENPYFCFSGWGAELDPRQQRLIDRRLELDKQVQEQREKLIDG